MIKKLLKSVDEYNTEKRKYDRPVRIYPGVKCPHCQDGQLFHWSTDCVILTSSPPQRRYNCTDCKQITNLVM